MRNLRNVALGHRAAAGMNCFLSPVLGGCHFPHQQDQRLQIDSAVTLSFLSPTSILSSYPRADEYFSKKQSGLSALFSSKFFKELGKLQLRYGQTIKV